MAIRTIVAALVAVTLSGPVYSQERTDLMPRVIEVTESQMHALWCGETANCPTPYMLYGQGFIYVQTGYQPVTVRDVGILLHEFVHHLQHMVGMVGRECRGTLERQAYGIQEEWLRQNHLEPKPGVDFPGPLLRMMAESCGEGW
jgi:hypothetical protein